MLTDVCPSSSIRTRGSRAIERTVVHIEENFADRINLADLAAIAELSVFRFVKVFHQKVGVSPHRYLCGVRVRQAKELLREGVPPAIAAIEVGFFDQSHLCRHFKSQCGVTPGQYLAGLRAGFEMSSDAEAPDAAAWLGHA